MRIYPKGIEKRLHDEARCLSDRYCAIHRPSNHHMNGWDINIRETVLAERLCPHGIGHPDPDSVNWLTKVTGRTFWGTHGCDGCCQS